MKRLILILIILCISIFNLKSQSLQELQGHANQSYKDQKFKESFKLYERILYFKDSIISYDFFMLGECKNQLNEYDDALYYYNLAVNQEDIDSIKTNYYLKICRILISKKKYPNAIQKLLIAEKTANEKQLVRIKFLLASTYFLVDDHMSSKFYFDEIIEDTIQLSLLFSYTSRKYPNAKKAFWLSTFFPGMGQFYLGNFKEGINSLLLNTSLGLLFFHTSYESSLISASISIYPWLHRYLTGGAENARKLAVEKRNKNNQFILSEIINLYSEY